MKKYKYRIRRFDPEKGSSPKWEEFIVEMAPFERLLDGLLKIKDALDGSLTFRRSCAHGICGSCAMKIDGKNRLACQTLIKDVKKTITFEPLPAFPVLKDLVVDMDFFFREKGKSSSLSDQ